MADEYDTGYNDGVAAAQGGGGGGQRRGGGAMGMASLATTGVFLGRSLSSSFANKTDQIASKGLAEGSKLFKAMAADSGKVAANAAKAGKETGVLGQAAGVASRFFLTSSKALENMSKSLPKMSKGFGQIGTGSMNAIMGLIFGKGVGGRLKLFAAGLGEVALGLASVGRAALMAMPALLPLAAIILAIVAAVKLIKYTVHLFKDEIKEMKDKALEPWKDAIEKVSDAFHRSLAPAVALIMMAIKGLFAVIEALGNVMGPIIEKMIGPAEAGSKVFEKVIIFMLTILQFFVDAIVRMINFYRVTFGIFTNSNLSVGEKFKLFGKLLLTVWMDTVISIINFVQFLKNKMIDIIELILNGVVYLWKKQFDILNKITGGALGKILNFVFDAMRSMVDLIADAWQAVFDTIRSVINGIVNALQAVDNKLEYLVPDGLINGLKSLSSGLGNVAHFADSFYDSVNGAITKLQDLLNAKDIGSFSDFMKSEFAISLDAVKDFTDITGDKIKEMLEALKSKFGLDMEAIAEEAGVDLINSPDLVGEFKKLLAAAKIKIEDDQLNKHLNELGDKIDGVNEKDVKIEINPLIQIHIEGVSDPEEVRRIALEALDEGLAKAGAQIAVSANSGEL